VKINALLLIFLRLVSAVVGFGAAVSFMRAQSSAFDFYFGRLMRIGFNMGTGFDSRLSFDNGLNFGAGPSAVLLIICLAVFTFSILLRKGAQPYPVRRIDYGFLLMVCVAGFLTCSRLAWAPSFPGWLWENPLLVIVLVVPFIAYLFALLAFGELIARLRDRTLATTLYWVGFFKVYSIWRPVGLLAFLLLAVQIAMLILFIGILSIVVVSLFILGSLTYFAVHMINLATEYDIAAADKIRSERFKSELITSVSHDIRTPLTSIINYVDLLNNEGLEGQPKEYVQVLARKSTRLKVLIDDLMEASKAGTGNLSVDMQKLNLAEIIGQVAGEFEDSFAENNLTLVIRQMDGAIWYGDTRHENAAGPEEHLFHQDPIWVNADSRHLYRTLENLFSNTVKYSLSNTRVFIETSPREGKVLFTLQNTSATPIEMAGEELTEQFIRGDKARNTEGSGLGLYIAKSLIELMGGVFRIHAIGDLFRVEVELTIAP